MTVASIPREESSQRIKFTSPQLGHIMWINLIMCGEGKQLYEAFNQTFKKFRDLTHTLTYQNLKV